MNFAAFIIVVTYETSGMKRTAGFTLIALMVYINIIAPICYMEDFMYNSEYTDTDSTKKFAE